jgi:ribosomal-protein-alanine N-acetyltransferase
MIVSVDTRTNIRRMRIDDLPQVQAVDEISFSTPWPKNAYRHELLENPNAHCWVVEAEGKIAGLMVCWLILDEAHIATIAVHPAQRGLGFSKALVATGLTDLISKGAVSATLEVRSGNFVAQNLYRYFGFEEVGLRKRYYKDTNEDALLMTVQPLGLDYVDWLNTGARVPWQSSNPS